MQGNTSLELKQDDRSMNSSARIQFYEPGEVVEDQFKSFHGKENRLTAVHSPTPGEQFADGRQPSAMVTKDNFYQGNSILQIHASQEGSSIDQEAHQQKGRIIGSFQQILNNQDPDELEGYVIEQMEQPRTELKGAIQLFNQINNEDVNFNSPHQQQESSGQFRREELIYGIIPQDESDNISSPQNPTIRSGSGRHPYSSNNGDRILSSKSMKSNISKGILSPKSPLTPQSKKSSASSQRRRILEVGRKTTFKNLPVIKESSLQINREKYEQTGRVVLEKKPVPSVSTKSIKMPKKQQFKCVISRMNLWYKAFSTILVWSGIISSFVYAYFAAFVLDNEEHEGGTAVDKHDEETDNRFRWFQIIIELLFGIDLIIQFFLDYEDKQANETVRDLKKITVRYLSTYFVWDLLCLIPFTAIFNFKLIRVMYLLKCIRLRYTNQLFDTLNFINALKKYMTVQHQSPIDPMLPTHRNQESPSSFSSRIKTVVVTTYIFKTMKLVIQIFMVSYFLGVLFFVFCDVTNSYTKDTPKEDSFITQFDFDLKENFDKAIGVTYFAFTTLSTVGLGDLHPRSDSERMYTAFLLLFGVLLFSYVLGKFFKILISFKQIEQGFNDSSNLSRFFGVIRQLNHNRDIERRLKIQIEDYFEYRWNHDKNLAIQTKEDLSLLEQLPSFVQGQIYCDFLYYSFLKKFMKYFSIQNHGSRNIHSFYTWDHQEYQNFMIMLLQFLDPIHLKPNTTIFSELDNVNEVIFVENGFYNVGYEINKKVQFKLRHPSRTVIGAFEASYNCRSMFIYKTFGECSGFSIRIKNWKILEEKNPVLFAHIRRKALFNYIHRIRSPLLRHKEEDIKLFERRADYRHHLFLHNSDNLEIQKIVFNEFQRNIYGKVDKEEIILLKGTDEKLSYYEKYIKKIMTHYDDASHINKVLCRERESLIDDNRRLRSLAKEMGMDISFDFDPQKDILRF